MADKFRERFEVIRGATLRANYGQNPWQEHDQVITSVSWASLVDDARESLLRSRWDLVIVDEAHRMSARSEDHMTYAYRLGRELSKMTDHYLLMTATPHKGDPEHFRRFLALLDADVYGSIESLQQAMREQEAPFYLRRTKEALVTFPDPETGAVKKLFTKREVHTAAFDLDGEELDFYDELTRYVEDQSIAAAGDQSARGRAVGFTMAMLQRRMASSVYAVRRSLERMRDRRENILADPEKYRREQIARRIPEDFDELDEEDQQEIIAQLEDEVLSYDPAVLQEEIAQLNRLVEHAKQIEGRDVQSKLKKLRSVLMEQGTDQVFDVVGEVFPANLLERLLRDMYARQTDEHKIQDRIVRDVSPDRFRAITESALEGLAKKDLNLSAIVGRSAEAKERRLVPEVVEQFFVEAAPESGLRLKAEGGRRKAEEDKHNVSSVLHPSSFILHPSSFVLHPSVYRVGKTPKNLLPIGDAQERRYGRLGREYARIVFDKELLKADPNVEWVTPGHPLFEAVRTDVLQRVDDDMRRGAVFYDLHRAEPAVLDIFAASVKDGRGNTLHRRLFGVETSPDGRMMLREPTYLHAITPAPQGTPAADGGMPLPHRQLVEQFLYEHALQPWGERAAAERAAEVVRVAKHVEISLNALIDRQNIQLGEYLNRQVEGQTVPGLDGLISQAEQHLDELNNRLETRRRELELEGHSAVADITHLGRAWVLPHPERASPQLAPMIRDDDFEKIAVQEAIRHEEARGWVVESVETENRGFDLISRRPHPEDPKTFVELRFIEVKGRAGVGVVALSENEYRTAERLKNDYWLYAVFNCAGAAQLYGVQNPARLGWQPVVTVEHYRLDAQTIMRTGI